MGKLGLSATDIGLRIGATPVEVNRLLKDQGFLYGEPGAYGLTPKGKEFGAQQPHDNGYGGYAHRSWETTHFDPSITDVIDSGPEKLAKVRADIAAHKQEQKATRETAETLANADFHASQADREAEDIRYEYDPGKILLGLVAAAVLAGTTFGVYRSVRWYKNKKTERAAQAESARGTDTSTNHEGK